jgi:enoyl-CoA hydratase
MAETTSGEGVMSTEKIVSVEQRGKVRLLTLDDPDTRNALSPAMLTTLVEEALAADADDAVGAIVIAGSPKIFAAGADIRMLATAGPTDMYLGERAAQWDTLRRVRTPMVAAVSGACLGGGLELALSCDIVLCSRRSKFGLPETSLGLIPGAGGTQLLTRLVGTAIAMDIVLSGRVLDGEEAVAAGLASRAFPEDSWLEDALGVATEVAARPALAQLLAKDSVRTALDMPLAAGIDAERRAFAMALGSPDAREGLSAFLEKRPPSWRAE